MIKQVKTLAVLIFFNSQINAQLKLTADFNESSFKNEILAIKRGVFWGYVDTAGKEISPFSDIGFNHINNRPTAKNYNRNFYISYSEATYSSTIFKNGNKLKTPPLLRAYGFNESLCLALKKVPNARLIGNLSTPVCYINENGTEAFKMPVGYDYSLTSDNTYLEKYFGGFHEGLAYVPIKITRGNISETKYGYINSKGILIVKPIYNKVNDFKEGRAIVCRKDKYGVEKWGVIDNTGKEITDFIYSNEPSAFYNGLSIIKNTDGKYGYLDRNGRVVIEPKYLFASSFTDGQAIVKEGENVNECLIKIIDSTGKFVKVIGANDELDFTDDIGIVNAIFFNDLIVCKNAQHKYGAIDKNGKIVIAFEFNYLEPFSCNRAFAKTDNKIGCINKKGNWVFEIVKSEK